MAFATLPHNKLTWSAYAGGDVFVQYNVYRRKRLGWAAAVADFASLAAHYRFKEKSGVVADEETVADIDGVFTGVTLDQTGFDVTNDPASSSILLDGASGWMKVSDIAALQNLFDGGGTVGIKFNLTSDGEGNAGHLISKGAWHVYVSDEAGGNVRLNFLYDFDGATDGLWVTAVNVSLAANHTLFVKYDADATGNNPTFVLDGVELTVGSGLTETTAPDGTRVTDVGSDLYVGNRAADDRTTDGTVGEPCFFNAALDTDEMQYLNSSTGTVASTWVRIAAETTEEVLRYDDYTAASGTTYSYAVTVSATIGGSTLESVKQSPPVEGALTFGATFLHMLADPEKFNEITAKAVTITPQQEVSHRRARGRRQPTAFIGEGLGNRIELGSVAEKSDDVDGWDELVDLVDQQFSSGATLCLRIGHRAGATHFVTLDNLEGRDAQAFTWRRISCTEIYYDEAV